MINKHLHHTIKFHKLHQALENLPKLLLIMLVNNLNNWILTHILLNVDLKENKIKSILV
jgi:hypothetical protein